MIICSRFNYLPPTLKLTFELNSTDYFWQIIWISVEWSDLLEGVFWVKLCGNWGRIEIKNESCKLTCNTVIPHWFTLEFIVQKMNFLELLEPGFKSIH